MRKIKKKLTIIYEMLEKHFGFQNWWPGESPFEVIVGAILTQNTNWSNVEKAIDNLKNKDLLLPEKIFSIHEHELASLIRPSGYYNQKSKKIKYFINFFHDFFHMDIKKMKKIKKYVLRDLLLNVNGIGKETSDSILLYALGKKIFVIDAYTKRIFYRLGFLKNEKEEYDEVRLFFENNLPLELKLYKDYHAQLVMLGKHHCKKTKPLCEECPLNDVCEKSVMR
ncbi:MAG: endonuclease [Candidatus Aureabacteria bacterium]|nr:endonuclease [Candidatus Auribacterota bacterium]